MPLLALLRSQPQGERPIKWPRIFTAAAAASAAGALLLLVPLTTAYALPCTGPAPRDAVGGSVRNARAPAEGGVLGGGARCPGNVSSGRQALVWLTTLAGARACTGGRSHVSRSELVVSMLDSGVGD